MGEMVPQIYADWKDGIRSLNPRLSVAKNAPVTYPGFLCERSEPCPEFPEPSFCL